MWTNWDPFAELDAVRREVNRVFQGFVPGDGNRRKGLFAGPATRGYPLIRLYEDAEGVYVEALAPGLDPASLQVTVKGRTLEIAGERPEVPEAPRQAYHRAERTTGRFSRRIELETEIDEERVAARYERGMLYVDLPRSEKAKPRQIAVSAN